VSANTRFDVLADLPRRKANLQATCGCGHVGVVDAEKLMRWFFVQRWPSALAVVGMHLRCSLCRGRPIKLRPTLAKPSGPEWGPRTDADWKRVVQRLRD